MRNTIQLTCATCGASFFVYPRRAATAKYCSNSCRSKGLVGKQGARKGCVVSEETRMKMSRAAMGNKHMVGYRHTDETKLKMSESARGRPGTRTGSHPTEETRLKLSAACKGKPANNKGTHLSPAIKRKISINRRGKATGESNPNWQGGKSFKPYCAAFTRRLRENIRDAFGRKCFMCGISENGEKLSVHHVDYNKGQGCGRRWSLVPLCRTCHMKTTNNRHYYFNLLSNYWAFKYIEFTEYAGVSLDFRLFKPNGISSDI